MKIIPVMKVTAMLLAVASFVPAISLAADGMEIDLITHNSVLVQASPAEIWPKIVEPGEWKSGAQLVAIEGSAGELNARFKAVMPEASDQVAFFIKNVEMVPERTRTVRLTSTDGSLMGYASWELSPQGDGTTVTYHVYSMVTVPEESLAGVSEEERIKLREDYQSGNAARFQNELEALKKLIETPATP